MGKYDDMGYKKVSFREYMLITGKWVALKSHKYEQGFEGSIAWINKKTGKKEAIRMCSSDNGKTENYVKGDLLG